MNKNLKKYVIIGGVAAGIIGFVTAMIFIKKKNDELYYYEEYDCDDECDENCDC